MRSTHEAKRRTIGPTTIIVSAMALISYWLPMAVQWVEKIKQMNKIKEKKLINLSKVGYMLPNKYNILKNATFLLYTITSHLTDC